MDNNEVQTNPVPSQSEKEKSLENIVSLGKSVADAYKSIRIAAVLLMLAALGYVFAGMSGLTSPFMFPILMTVMVGNQVYSSRTRNTQKKLDEMKKAYESRFGAIVSSN